MNKPPNPKYHIMDILIFFFQEIKARLQLRQNIILVPAYF